MPSTTMTDSQKKRLTLRHALAAAGVLALLIGFGQNWSAIVLTTGQTVTLTGTDQAPLAISLLLVAAASHALALLVYRGAHLAAVIVGLVGSAGALWATLSALANPVGSASATITQLTGLSGSQTLESLIQDVTPNTFAVGVSVTGVVALIVSSLIGLTIWRVKPETASRFERPAGTGEQHPWDEISDGGDPTAR